jgi:FXSXX-COOH protein
MTQPITDRDLDTLLINLGEVSLGEVLARHDTALAQAIERVVRSGTDDDRLKVAGFSNFT